MSKTSKTGARSPRIFFSKISFLIAGRIFVFLSPLIGGENLGGGAPKLWFSKQEMWFSKQEMLFSKQEVLFSKQEVLFSK